jgi:hypothetical protein
MGRLRLGFGIVVVSVALLAACDPPPPHGAGSLPPPVDNSAGVPTDPTNLPLGDYHVSLTTPAVGSIYICNILGGGGAFADGPWIHSNGTWDSTTKVSVQGSVNWPTASLQITPQADRRIIDGNGLPISHTTGVFPIQPTDPAYAFDRNPNPIHASTVAISVPLDPVVATQPSCLPGGPIGYSTTGVAFFDGLDAADRDANAHEIQDHCGGHPQESGIYHYHSASECIPGVDNSTPTLIGYALDGFGIYNSRDQNGNELTNNDLDECHGTTSPVPWNGTTQTIYHYVATRAYPYTLGCFRGDPRA